ncbi:hypothetical protein H5410_051906 [Solanum commersonii]|uniref:Uncharacterized protein n=1 Tax=Solanum commersonii TaxID=4109 RepID=A0A9J5X0S7_SOLCO|nr:hypothetical protein H5410_051906 [Solanum commersonii]
MEGNPYAQILLQLKDQSMYNIPTVNQVVALWIDENNQNIPFEREIIVHQHSRKRNKRQPHRRSGHSPTLNNDIPLFISADAILSNEDQDVRCETKGNVSCKDTIVTNYKHEKQSGQYYCYVEEERFIKVSLIVSAWENIKEIELGKECYFHHILLGGGPAHVLVVEFQNRRVPHIHLLLILKEGYKIKSGDQYDSPYNNNSIKAKDGYPIYKEEDMEG